MQKEYIILIIIILFFVIVSNYKCTENFADTPTLPAAMITADNLRTAIYEIYQADVRAIQNLTGLAQQLQKGGLTIPGDINIKGEVKIFNYNYNNLLSFNKTENQSDNNSAVKHKWEVWHTSNPTNLANAPEDTHDLVFITSDKKGSDAIATDQKNGICGTGGSCKEVLRLKGDGSGLKITGPTIMDNLTTNGDIIFNQNNNNQSNGSIIIFNNDPNTRHLAASGDKRGLYMYSYGPSGLWPNDSGYDPNTGHAHLMTIRNHGVNISPPLTVGNISVNGTTTSSGLITANGGLTVTGGGTISGGGNISGGLTVDSIICKSLTDRITSLESKTTKLNTYGDIEGDFKISGKLEVISQISCKSGPIYAEASTIRAWSFHQKGLGSRSTFESGINLNNVPWMAPNRNRTETTINLFDIAAWYKQVSQHVYVDGNGDGLYLGWHGGWCDRRIKENIVVADSNELLDKINKLPMQNYKFIDNTVFKGRTVYGLIAQEVKEVFPEAVEISKRHIPNINKPATHQLVEETVILTVDNDTNVDDSLQLLVNDIVKIVKVIEATETTIKVAKWDDYKDDDTVLVYGTEINDFHGLNQQYMGVLCMGGIQELSKQVSALREENNVVKQSYLDIMSEVKELKEENNVVKQSYLDIMTEVKELREENNVVKQSYLDIMTELKQLRSLVCK